MNYPAIGGVRGPSVRTTGPANRRGVQQVLLSSKHDPINPFRERKYGVGHKSTKWISLPEKVSCKD